MSICSLLETNIGQAASSPQLFDGSDEVTPCIVYGNRANLGKKFEGA